VQPGPFRLSVADRTPASVKIKLFRHGDRARRSSVGNRPTDHVQRYRRRCTLARGCYIWVLFANDLAGNSRRAIGERVLILR
jgi:hypothetical protein